jgi:hypothetical protein
MQLQYVLLLYVVRLSVLTGLQDDEATAEEGGAEHLYNIFIPTCSFATVADT